MKAKLKESVMVRVESDDYAMVYDADTGSSFAITPTAVYIANCLTGEKTIQNIADKIREEFEEVPENIEAVVEKFILTLIERKMAEAVEE